MKKKDLAVILDKSITLERLKIKKETEKSFIVEYDFETYEIAKSNESRFVSSSSSAPSMRMRQVQTLEQRLIPESGIFQDDNAPIEFKEVMMFHELREMEYVSAGFDDAHNRAVHDETLYAMKFFDKETFEKYMTWQNQYRGEKKDIIPVRKINDLTDRIEIELPYDQIFAFGEVNNEIAYWGRKNRNIFVVHGTKTISTPFDAIYGLEGIEDRLVFLAKKKDSNFIMDGDERIDIPYEEIIEFSGILKGKPLYVVKDKGKNILINGQEEIGRHDKIGEKHGCGNKVFIVDGQATYVACEDGKTYVVHGEDKIDISEEPESKYFEVSFGKVAGKLTALFHPSEGKKQYMLHGTEIIRHKSIDCFSEAKGQLIYSATGGIYLGGELYKKRHKAEIIAEVDGTILSIKNNKTKKKFWDQLVLQRDFKTFSGKEEIANFSIINGKLSYISQAHDSHDLYFVYGDKKFHLGLGHGIKKESICVIDNKITYFKDIKNDRENIVVQFKEPID